MRQITYTLVAILVDICGIACLLLLVTQKVKKSETEQRIVTVQRNIGSVATNLVTVRCNGETVKRNIVDRVYGEQPIMRKIIAAEGIRHPVLKQVFTALIQEGLMVRVGHSFQLTQTKRNRRPERQSDI